MKNNKKDAAVLKERGIRMATARKMAGVTLKDLGKKYGFGYSTLRQWEHGKIGGLTNKGAKKLIEALKNEGVISNLAWLMHGTGPNPFYEQAIESGGGIPTDQSTALIAEQRIISQEINYFQSLNPTAVTLMINDDAMEPLFRRGDQVGGATVPEDQRHLILHEPCIIATSDNMTLCRIVSPGSELALYDLFCTNSKTHAKPTCLNDVELLYAAPVTRLWRKSDVKR